MHQLTIGTFHHKIFIEYALLRAKEKGLAVIATADVSIASCESSERDVAQQIDKPSDRNPSQAAPIPVSEVSTT